MTTPEIKNAIPHREPMLLVDEILEKSDERIVCGKTFRADEYFVQGHYPGNPIVPGVILCESAVQSGAILLAEKTGSATGVPVLTRLNDVRFKNMVRPGDTIRNEITIDEIVSSAFYCTARVTHNGKPVVRFSFACTLASPNE